MVSFNTHVSEAQVTIGLITVLHNFSFEYLVTNLLLKETLVLHSMPLYEVLFCTMTNKCTIIWFWCWSILASVASFYMFCLTKWLHSFSVTLAWCFLVADFCLLDLYYFSICTVHLLLLWTMTNKCTQLFHKLSHSYMFRHYRVILRQLVINNLLIYTSISNAAVCNTIYNITQYNIKYNTIQYIQLHLKYLFNP